MGNIPLYYLPPFGDMVYNKITESGQRVVVRLESAYSQELVVVGHNRITRKRSDNKSYRFKHGSKSFLEGYRWFRKKTPQGYAMGLIQSGKIASPIPFKIRQDSAKDRCKTFVEVFNPFEYKLIKLARKRVIENR